MPRGQRPYHPFTDFTNYKHNEWEMVCKCRDFLEDASLHGGNCKCLINWRTLKCNCLKVLEDSVARDAIALYIVAFFNKSKVDQQLTIMDWLRYTSADTKQMFFVPFLNPYDEEELDLVDKDTPHKHAVLAALAGTRVCKYPVTVILDWGRRKWETCLKNIQDNTTPTHGLKGKRPNNTQQFDDSDIVEDLADFFNDLKELGQPQSTRIMRVETGVGLRDGEEGVVELPPSYSKRSLYYRFCYDRGWNVTLKKNSNSVLQVTPVEPFEGEAKLICSWPYFLKYWDTNFANIKIVSLSADVCSKCHVFRNRLRYVRYETTTEPGTDTTHSFTEPSLKRYFLNKKLDCSEVVIAERETREVCDRNDVYAPLVMEAEAALSENNKILMEASLHVKQAADQRRVCNTKIKLAHQDYLHGIQHSKWRYCLVVDYCQNAQLPNLGATQPGETYYMSPLTVPILGLVDCSFEGGSLDAFVYHEGIGGKGGDNVASIIIMLLKHKGWLKEDDIGGELTVLMDNWCGGQNKNNHMLCLANLLVEAGYFKMVNFMFYVVGHTKNCADQWFNTMKRDYRNQNLYTFEQLCKALGTNERITIHSVKDGDFKHYKRLEDLFYKELKTGTIQPGHIFTVESDAPTTMKIWQDQLGTAAASVQDLQRRVTVDCDCRLWEAIRDSVLLNPVAPTGIKEIKQIEMFTKWRKLVPAEFADIISPYPGDEVMRKFKEERNRKARERTRQRKRDTSNPTPPSTPSLNDLFLYILLVVNKQVAIGVLASPSSSSLSINCLK
eukprot:jgi/Psemu1/1854/gm1.1854_g